MKYNAVRTPNGLKVKFHGDKDRVIKFIESEQLLDRELWRLFVAQFRLRNDWESRGWRGEFWGKMMRGGCMTYAYTQSRKLYSVLKESVLDFLTTQDEKGRFTTYGDNREFEGWDMWGRKYAMLGLLYFYDICGDKRLKSRILNALLRHADYIVAHIGDGEGQKNMFETFLGVWGYGGLPASSILEPFMKLYFLTKKPRYLDFATYIVNRGFSELENIVEAAADETRYPHEYKTQKAYEMMSCFQGLLEYYKATEEERYLHIVEGFFTKVAESELTVIGGLGCRHEFFNQSVREQTNRYDGPMLETCVTVTWMNLCYHLYLFTGKSRYVDYIEQSYVNAMRGAVNLNKNQKVYRMIDNKLTLFNTGGVFFLFDSYSPLYEQRRAIDLGGKMQLSEDGKFYGCCVCIASLGPAIAAATSLVFSAGRYAINAFEKCTMQFETESGNKVIVKVKGDILKGNGRVRYLFSMDKEEKVPFTLRIPEWSSKYRVYINGEEQKKDRKKPCQVLCDVSNGDCVELALDVRVKMFPVNDKKVLKKGPYILSRDERYEEDFYAPAEISGNKNGTVCAKKVKKALFHVLAEYEIPLKDGGTVTVCDYSSAGSEWDREIKTKLNVWF